MAPAAVNPAHQAFILARLSEFCRFHSRPQASHEDDPWGYMRSKLHQIEPELAALKGELLAATRKRIAEDLKAGPLDGETAADFKVLLEKLLTRGDFADAAFHLDPAAGPGAAEEVDRLLEAAVPTNAFAEEKLAPADRNPAWEKLVGELNRRLGIDALEKVLGRKTVTARRRRMVLRRLRRNVAEYCTVVRIPTTAEDTFTPFMLPRIEAVLAACLRFLNRYR